VGIAAAATGDDHPLHRRDDTLGRIVECARRGQGDHIFHKIDQIDVVRITLRRGLRLGQHGRGHAARIPDRIEITHGRDHRADLRQIERRQGDGLRIAFIVGLDHHLGQTGGSLVAALGERGKQAVVIVAVFRNVIFRGHHHVGIVAQGVSLVQDAHLAAIKGNQIQMLGGGGLDRRGDVSHGKIVAAAVVPATPAHAATVIPQNQRIVVGIRRGGRPVNILRQRGNRPHVRFRQRGCHGRALGCAGSFGEDDALGIRPVTVRRGITFGPVKLIGDGDVLRQRGRLHFARIGQTVRLEIIVGAHIGIDRPRARRGRPRGVESLIFTILHVVADRCQPTLLEKGRYFTGSPVRPAAIGHSIHVRCLGRIICCVVKSTTWIDTRFISTVLQIVPKRIARPKRLKIGRGPVRSPRIGFTVELGHLGSDIFRLVEVGVWRQSLLPTIQIIMFFRRQTDGSKGLLDACRRPGHHPGGGIKLCCLGRKIRGGIEPGIRGHRCPLSLWVPQYASSHPMA